MPTCDVRCDESRRSCRPAPVRGGSSIPLRDMIFLWPGPFDYQAIELEVRQERYRNPKAPWSQDAVAMHPRINKHSVRLQPDHAVIFDNRIQGYVKSWSRRKMHDKEIGLHFNSVSRYVEGGIARSGALGTSGSQTSGSRRAFAVKSSLVSFSFAHALAGVL